MANHFIKGASCAASGGICWALSGCFGQYMFQYLGMDSRWLVPIRLSFAGIVLLIYCFAKYQRKTLDPWKTPRTAIRLLIYGIPGIAFCQFTYFQAIQYSSAAFATIIQDFSPIFILTAACIAAKRFPKTIEIISIILAIIGVFLIMTHGRLDGLRVPVSAVIAGLFSAVCVTVYNVVPGKVLQKYPLVILQGWSFLLGGIVIAFVFRSWEISYVPDLIGILGIAFVVLVGNVLAFNLYMTGVRYIGPEKSILFGFSEPVMAAVITTLFLGNTFTWIDAIGFIMVFTMLALNSLAGKE